MKKMEEEVISLVKGLEGYLLAVGVDNPKILNAVINNKKINQSYSLKNKTKHDKDSEEITLKKINKKIKIKVNYVLCDIDGIGIYLWSMIRNTYKLVSDKIIFYGNIDSYDTLKISKKYTRYGSLCDIKRLDDGYLIIVDVTNLKINPFKKICYYVIDFLVDIVDAIGNGLMQ